MHPISGQTIFGFYEPGQRVWHLPELGQSSNPIDKSPVKLPRVLGKDELEHYQHSPIDASNQIRLIELLPPKKASAGRNSVEPLRCKILSPAFHQTPEYEALSYTWGNMNRHLPISVIIDQSDDQALLATPQLIMALKRLRLPSASRLLWVDQLCIDQDNNDEKGPQIQLMGDIYMKAQRVVIWLGEDHDHYIHQPAFRKEADTELLADMIDMFTKASSRTSTDDLKLAEQLVDVRPSYHINSIEQRRIGAIYEILSRPWFRRAWIFQEASLARELLVQYGPLEVKIEDLKRLFDAVYLLELEMGIQRERTIARNTGGFEMIQLIQDTRQGRLEPDSAGVSSKFLLTLLQVLRRVQAFDPRDLIFAFLAFQVDEGIKATAESYRQTQEQVWMHAAKCIIKASQSLDTFAALSGDTKRQLQLPSWVPYWADCFPYSRPIAMPVSRFRASRGMPHIWKKSDDPKKLHVRGKIVDRINEFLTLSLRKFAGTRSPTHLFLSWGMLRQSAQHYLLKYQGILGDQLAVKLGTLERDLMRTVLADGAMGSEQPLHCVYEMIDANNHSDTAQKLGSAGKKEELTEEQKEILSDYEKLEALVLVAEEKRVFMTDNLQLGMAPSAAQKGDQIAIIHGSKVPCILREVEGGPHEYRVISQCYLDGWMYGKSPNDRPHPHSKWWEEQQDEFVLV